MAVPKSKISRSRRNKRRSHHALSPQARMECPACGELKRPYQVCPECGFYNGREVIARTEEFDEVDEAL